MRYMMIYFQLMEHFKLLNNSRKEGKLLKIPALFGLCSVINKVELHNFDRAQQHFAIIRQALEATNVVEINFVNMSGTVEQIT